MFDIGTVFDDKFPVTIESPGGSLPLYTYSPCVSRKDFCPDNTTHPANVSVCEFFIVEFPYAPPQEVWISQGMVPDVSYSVVDDNPKNFTIVAKYAPTQSGMAKFASQFTFVYDPKYTTANATVVKETVELSLLEVRSNLVRPYKP